MASEMIFDPDAAGRPLRVAGFMSGSGTNLIRLWERQKELAGSEGGSPFELAFIFSDRSDGKAQGEAIARNAGIPYFSFDIRRFHEIKGASRSVGTNAGMALRQEYDQVAGKLIQTFGVDLIALGGYMSFITLNRCVNVHPADLTKLDEDGKRRFVGDDAVLDAILAGERELHSSTIWTDQGVDTGPLLMLSPPLKVEPPIPLDILKDDPDLLRKTADEHQERLKEAGDWVVFPATVEAIARGRMALDDTGKVYVDGKSAPEGITL